MFTISPHLYGKISDWKSSFSVEQHLLLGKYTENVSFRQVESQTTDIDPRTITVDMMPTLIGIGRTALQFLVVELIQQSSLSKDRRRSCSNNERAVLRTYVIEFIVDLPTK